MSNTDQWRREIENADKRISSTNMTIATKEPISEPEVRSQKLLNCWQIANQLAEALPLCAKYTIAAAADAADVNRPNAAYIWWKQSD